MFWIFAFGEMIQFDEHIFSKMGWFNHQLEKTPTRKTTN